MDRFSAVVWRQCCFSSFGLHHQRTIRFATVRSIDSSFLLFDFHSVYWQLTFFPGFMTFFHLGCCCLPDFPFDTFNRYRLAWLHLFIYLTSLSFHWTFFVAFFSLYMKISSNFVLWNGGANQYLLSLPRKLHLDSNPRKSCKQTEDDSRRDNFPPHPNHHLVTELELFTPPPSPHWWGRLVSLRLWPNQSFNLKGERVLHLAPKFHRICASLIYGQYAWTPGYS